MGLGEVPGPVEAARSGHEELPTGHGELVFGRVAAVVEVEPDVIDVLVAGVDLLERTLAAGRGVPVELQLLRSRHRSHRVDDAAPVVHEGLGVLLRRPGVPIAVELPPEAQDGVALPVLDEGLGELTEVLVEGAVGTLAERPAALHQHRRAVDHPVAAARPLLDEFAVDEPVPGLAAEEGEGVGDLAAHPLLEVGDLLGVPAAHEHAHALGRGCPLLLVRGGGTLNVVLAAGSRPQPEDAGHGHRPHPCRSTHHVLFHSVAR
ncbi:hypothetical protein BH18ACT1_BH18ACT1_02300 [soil metagenome]